MMILVISVVVIIVVIGGVFWLWLQATHGEVGPALVATALSIVVIVVALYFMLALQNRGGEDEGRLREPLPAYAGALLERPLERPAATRVSG